jgi:hypothetical protein
MEKWESGVTRNDAGAWVIVPDVGTAIVKFHLPHFPKLANITGGEAVTFTRNPILLTWAADVQLDTGLQPLLYVAKTGATLTPAAEARLKTVLADRLFWASFLPSDEQTDAAQELNDLLVGLTGQVTKQSLIDKKL